MDISSTAEFPKALRFLFDPAPYKIAYGGRGGAKSENISQALIILASQVSRRVLCTRETQRSISSSVHAMLASWIEKLGFGPLFDVQQNKIVSSPSSGMSSEFLFWGMQDMNAIKSIHEIDITWVEEAQTVPKDSWEKLLPTVLRKPGSELWISFNPELDTDDTYTRFVLDPPPGAVVRKTTYRDNPFFTEELRAQMEDLREKDHQAYLHVWEGETKSAVTGAVYEEELRAVEAGGRITDVAVDRLRPVDTFWDLGFGDPCAIWFAQAMESGHIRVVDYLESRGKTLEWYLIQLQQRGYVYGTHWLPHDGVDALIHHRFSGDKSKSPEMIMRNMGLNVRIAPKLHTMSGINAARTIMPSCWFDRTNCSDGLRALRSYQWGKPSSSGVERREPLHDWASHGADAFRTLAVSIKHPERPEPPRSPRFVTSGRSGGGNSAGWMGM